MKKLLFTLAALPFLADADTVRILPLGDSITEGIGWTEGSGYRAVLRQKLTEAGYDVQYVGNNTANWGGFSQEADGHHEGHGGWMLYDIRNDLPQWFETAEDPHVILLLVGTNDFSWRFDYKNILYRMSGLLDELSVMQPSAQIIVSTLTPRTQDWDDNYLKPYFNDGLPALVAEHQAKGQKVTMIDLYSRLNRGKSGDFPDELHPNQTGYTKMAQVWFEGIQAVLPKSATENMAPNKLAVGRTVNELDHRGVRIYFNRRVDETTAADVSHYRFSGSFQPTRTEVAPDRRSVLVFGNRPLPEDEFTKVTVSGVKAEADSELVVEREVTICLPRAARYHVPEASLYRLVYALDIPANTWYKERAVDYLVDNHTKVGPYSRVAYYLRLENDRQDVKYAWVSMDKFTDDPGKLGVPTRASGAVFRQYVNNLHVFSNVRTVKPGEKEKGNIEFWPYNYGPDPSLGVGTTANDIFDVDDTPANDGDYACMQIHDSAALTPILSFNRRQFQTNQGQEIKLSWSSACW